MPRNPLTRRRERLQQAIANLTGGAQRRYPPHLRSKIVDYGGDCIHAGVPLTRVCAELGVSHPTLVRMLSEAKAPGLRPVRVVQQKPTLPEPRPALLVRGPVGITIDGLDLDGVAALIRALA
jgi:hypothetical protein